MKILTKLAISTIGGLLCFTSARLGLFGKKVIMVDAKVGEHIYFSKASDRKNFTLVTFLFDDAVIYKDIVLDNGKVRESNAIYQFWAIRPVDIIIIRE